MRHQTLNIQKQPFMYTVLDKNTIEMEIIPHIPLAKRGFQPTVPLVEIVNAILYKLKTGVQWHQLPTRVFFEQRPLSWEAVYYHYRKWCVNGVWKSCWISLLEKHKSFLDLSRQTSMAAILLQYVEGNRWSTKAGKNARPQTPYT